MNILVLHGPNLNLVGKVSAKAGDNITLGKINTSLKRTELPVLSKENVVHHDPFSKYMMSR